MNAKVGATISVVVIFLLCLFIVGSYSTELIEPGYVGIKVNLYGTDKGVQGLPLLTGRIWYNPITEKIYRFPTFMQTVTWTKSASEESKNDDSITFNSMEGSTINVDVSVGYKCIVEKVPAMFMEFRQPVEVITWGYIRSQVRDTFNRHASTMKIIEIFGSEKQRLLDLVKASLNENLNSKGFQIDMVSFVSALRPQDGKVVDAINSVITATQRAIEQENKVRQTEAEAKQKIAAADGEAASILAIAKSQAEANLILSRSLTEELIKIKYIEKWDGKVPMITGNATPLVNIPTK